MYIAAGQGQTLPGDKILMSTETSCRFGHLLQVSKNLFEVWFYTIFFMILYMYIAPRQGLTTPWGRIFYVNRNILSFWSFVASFKNNSLKSDFIEFFSWFNTCIYPQGRGAYSPQGTKFWCQQKCLVTSFICCKFQKNIFEVWFYTYFSWFNTCILPRAGADSPQGTTFRCQQKGLITLPICCKFQRNLIEVWFYTFFSWFNTCIYPQGRGAYSPHGTKFWFQQKLLVTSVICC